MARNRLILSVVAAMLLAPSFAHAECAMVDYKQAVEAAPIVVRAKVVESTDQATLNACANLGRENCRYRFVIDVSEVLKGPAQMGRIAIEYGYWAGCPGVDTFPVGTEQVWLLRTAAADGSAELNGASCGRGFIANDNPEGLAALKKVLKRNQ